MRDFLKNKLVTILVVVATLVLAGIAVFTAVRLYQLRRQAVAPTSPESEPLALAVSYCEVCGGITGIVCDTGFKCVQTDPIGTDDASGLCVPDSYNGDPHEICKSITPSCEVLSFSLTSSPTLTPSGSPTPTPTSSTSTPTPTSSPLVTSTPIAQASPAPTTPSLPVVGVAGPTITLIALGIFLVIGALALLV